MILGAARAVKLLILIVAIVMTTVSFCRKLSKRAVVGFGMLIVLYALVANFAANSLPALTDEIILTALGEKQENAMAEEIVLTGYTVDGAFYSAGKSLQIIDGKWFWSGENYMWRIESDPRQPTGRTRSIMVRMPVGWERSLNFLSDIWRGKVEIAANGYMQIVDTFSEGASELSVPVGRSLTPALILNQVCRIVVYATILLGLSAVTVAGVWFRLRHPEQAAVWLERNNGKMLYVLIAIVAGYLMFCFSGDSALWGDEMLQLDSVRGNLSKVIQNCLSMVDAAPPLYGICAWAWYRIAPYGERWLLLISVIPTAAAVYVIGLVGERLGGKYSGVLSALLLAFSSTVWNYAAFEFRSYAFVIFFSTFSLYCHLQRNFYQESKGWPAAYSLSLLGLAMSHYFGMLLCGLFFLEDLYLYVTRRIMRKAANSYVLPGGVSLVWLFLVYIKTLQYRTPEMVASWYPRPTPQNIVELLKFLTGNYSLPFYLFVFGAAYVFTAVWQKKNCGKDWSEVYQRMFLWTIFGAIALIYIYGNYISPKSTMWEHRYFIVLIPQVTLLSSLGVTELFSLGDERENCRWGTLTLVLGIILASHCMAIGASAGVAQPSRKSADWLYTQGGEIFEPDTVILQTCFVYESWQEYYVSRQSRRDPLNVVWQSSLSEKDLLSYNLVYVQYSWTPISEWLQTALDENYALQMDLPDIQMKVYMRK